MPGDVSILLDFMIASAFDTHHSQTRFANALSSIPITLNENSGLKIDSVSKCLEIYEKNEKKGKNKINKESQEVSEDFDSVVDDIMDQGKSREDAEKIAGAINAKYVGNYKQEEGLEEDARTDAEQEGYKDGFDDAKDDVKDALSKMKVSELKAKIREDILSELALTEEEEVDVDVDFEDEVDVDVEGDDIEIDRPAVKAKVNVGLSPEEEIIQDSLKAAMDAADSLGNDKLADQIGNTITFFTREYVVGRNDD